MTFALFLKNWDKILSFQQVKSNNDWLQNIDFIDFKTDNKSYIKKWNIGCFYSIKWSIL